LPDRTCKGKARGFSLATFGRNLSPDPVRVRAKRGENGRCLRAEDLFDSGEAFAAAASAQK